MSVSVLGEAGWFEVGEHGTLQALVGSSSCQGSETEGEATDGGEMEEDNGSRRGRRESTELESELEGEGPVLDRRRARRKKRWDNVTSRPVCLSRVKLCWLILMELSLAGFMHWNLQWWI
jgi:hypothetical protein